MSTTLRSRRARALAACLCLGGAALGDLACVNDDVHLYEVTLAGEVSIVDGAAATGRVHVELRHARSGEGGLAFPLREISEFELDGLGAFEEDALVPTDDGEGLVVYAWIDVDGDGILCAPGSPPELAGLSEVDGFPAHALSVAVVLERPCAGAESF